MSFNILLVDDNENFREEFTECFNQYNFINATNGKEALEIIKKPNLIDLVLLDYILPGINGIFVLKNMREICKDLPIVIISGKGSKETVISALRAGANDYIEKPIRITEVNEILQRLVLKKKFVGDFSGRNILKKLEVAKYFLKRNYDKKVTLEDVAELISLNPKYLSRKFQEYFKIGFNDFKLNLKITKAKHLLDNSSCTVSEVAYKIGYENEESLIRSFKKITGMTPAKYRYSNKINSSEETTLSSEC